MKILQVINNLDIGGAETLLKNYLLTNGDKDIENDICLLGGGNTFIVDQLKQKDIQVFNLGLKNKYNFRQAIKGIADIIKEYKYDCVHIHLFPGQYYGAILAKKFNSLPFIFTEHSTFNKRRDIKLFYPIEKWSYKYYKKLFCISEMTKRALVHWMPSLANKTEVLHGGIPIRNSKGENEEKVYDLVLVGSLRGPEKGVDIYIKAIKQVEDQITKAVVVGDGVLKDELIDLRNSLGLENKIEFVGNRDDVNSFLQRSRMFVLPSRWEGFGLAIVEAMANKLPVIATNTGGIPEIITDGYDGLLVKKEDVNDLSEKIAYLLVNKERAKELAENAYNTALNKFSIEVYTEKMNSYYKEICKEY